MSKAGSPTARRRAEAQPANTVVAPGTAATADLNFKVPKDYHRDFKLIATELDLSMRGFLDLVFDDFVKNNGERMQDVSPTIRKRLEKLTTKA